MQFYKDEIQAGMYIRTFQKEMFYVFNQKVLTQLASGSIIVSQCLMVKNVRTQDVKSLTSIFYQIRNIVDLRVNQRKIIAKRKNKTTELYRLH